MSMTGKGGQVPRWGLTYPGGPGPGGTAGPEMYPPPPPEKKGVWPFVLIGCLVGGGIGVVVLGILILIAFPNFLNFMASSKQVEVKQNLSALFTGQMAYFGE